MKLTEKVVCNENVEPFDVDGTLILHKNDIPPEDSVKIYDSIQDKMITVQINRPMVRLLLEAKDRGGHIIVWSKGGYKWAALVVQALNLQDKVDLIMTKPRAYYDDKDVKEWLTERIYINSDEKYK